MAYDPNFPIDNALIEAAPFRTQFQGIKDLIDAVPGLTGVVIDSVTTGAPGSPAQVTATVVGTELHLSFVLPQGNEGPTGGPGADGPPGPGVTAAVIDAVNTLPPGSPATVDAFMTGTVAHFTFGIPKGDTGAQGLAGDVTIAQLDTAIGGTSSNSNAVSTLNLTVSDPPTQAEVQAVASKMDELIMALRRV